MEWAKMGVLAAEMETAALYMNAARLGKNGLGIFTISDVLTTGEAATTHERQTSFDKMIEVSLKTTLRI
jgi:purine-nucleoside phosphorylase